MYRIHFNKTFGVGHRLEGLTVEDSFNPITESLGLSWIKHCHNKTLKDFGSRKPVMVKVTKFEHIVQYKQNGKIMEISKEIKF